MTPKTVLIIEDNEDIWLAAKTSLRKVCECIWASSAEKGLEIIHIKKPDVILMDLQLPMMSGIELTQKLRAMDEYRNMVIMAFTASALPEQKKEALDAGCNGIVSKPFTRKELIEALEPYLS
ncbi:MAG: response regulator [Nitrospinae bacterium]|nr:response regulator [Nitrospinota bacterium]